MTARLVTTDGAELCRNHRCPYLVLMLGCGACGQIIRWRYDRTVPHRWVRLVLGYHPPVMACSAACGVLLLEEMTKRGGLLVAPEHPAGAGRAPEPAG